MPKNLQSKLLRVLQEKQIYRVGATKPINVDVRIVSATNVNIKTAIREKGFRAVLVDVVHGFSHLLESVAEGDLGADGVTVRSDVTEDDEGIVGADGVSYFLKGVVFTHTDGTFA